MGGDAASGSGFPEAARVRAAGAAGLDAKDESPALSAVGRLSGMLAAPAPADTNDDAAEAAREDAIENRMLQPTISP